MAPHPAPSRARSLADPGPRRAGLDAAWRAANYLAAAQIYLRSNALLRRPLAPSDVKPRLLGHWGTVPGITLVYAHLNRLVQDTGSRVLLVVGPGHGAPGVLASVYLEGTLAERYPSFTRDEAGLERFVRAFSWPGGMPSHVTAQSPGSIHEGGELGYSLSHAFGAAFDQPEQIVACIVGDGEAETGPIAAAWHSVRYLDAARDGAVLPILHLNGSKISSPTILARTSDDDLERFFAGIGWETRVVAGDEPGDVHERLWSALDWAHARIRKVQAEARSGGLRTRARWPLLCLRTPKGWTGPKEVEGVPIEGRPASHQLPLKDPRANPAQFRALEAWLASYAPHELFDEQGRPSAAVLANLPPPELCLGRNPLANAGRGMVPLELPPLEAHAVAVDVPGKPRCETTRPLGRWLRDVFLVNPKTFRLFCPDETSSNRLDDVFAATARAFQGPFEPGDAHLARDGRVMEILSEHTCEGWLEGYVLTGRHGLFPCYEAFAVIVDSMVAQHTKWLKIANEVPWRAQVASLNFLLTSHSWRQDHNGYSHQGAGFIDNLLSKKSSIVRVYLPCDANTLLVAAQHCLASKQYVNLIVASKNAMPQWLSLAAAHEHAERGASTWDWAGHGVGPPHVVLACAGDTPTLETLAASQLLRRIAPDLVTRVVNVFDLFALASRADHPHGLDDAAFQALFGDGEVVFAFHGYPRDVHELVHHRPDPQRFHVRGYVEEGTTTTPFDMVVRNGMSRFQLATEALRRAGHPRFAELSRELAATLALHRAYIEEHGDDPPEITGWSWSPG
ncbi:MAG TPA: phosphoketolase family protein [Planctomycetota bacterium]|nr:phosphoketolase family protein [Planctomycetota bacterium]